MPKRPSSLSLNSSQDTENLSEDIQISENSRKLLKTMKIHRKPL